ncbi:Uncharacterised protein [Yersinia enterocolitica]|nr:Uncharacterised protein [Yersinia enterocolitica]
MLTGNHHCLLNRQNAFLHTMVGFYVQDSRCIWRDRGFKLFRQTFIGVSGFHNFTAAECHHGIDWRTKVNVMALR